MSQWYSAEKGMRPTTFSTRTRQRQRRGPICSGEMGRCGHRRGCGYKHANGYRLDAYGFKVWVPTVTGWFAYGCRLEHLQRRDDAVARALDEGLVPAQAAGGLLGGWVVRGGGWRVGR